MVGGTLTLTDGGKTATISTTGHNSSVAGISIGNASNYVEAGVTTTSVVSNTGNVNIKPKSGSSVDVFNAKIINLANPVNNNDAANKYYVDTGLSSKQDTLIAGSNINIASDGKTISAVVPTVGDATLTIQKNSTDVGTFTANATTNKTINITVPTTAADVNALPDSTKYAANLSLTIDSSTFVVTGQLKDQDGNNIGNAQTIDLPLESVVVNGSYDSATKEVVLTLENGNTIRFSVADLVSGLQSEITSANPLNADLVDDSTSTNKFVTSSDITTWNGKQDALTAGSNIQINGTTISATDTTYSAFTGATSGTAGTSGLVPAPAAGDDTKYLSGDGLWKTVSQYSLPIASSSTLGGIKVGNRLTIDSGTGVLSADSQTDNNFTTTLKDKLDGIAAGAEVNVQSDWTEADNTSDAYIQNKPNLATVATSGSYNDLSNKPTIPTVNNATLTIQKNSTNVATFTANASSNVTADISVPTKTSDLNNDSGFVTAGSLQDLAVQEGSTNPVFEGMTPIKTFTWTVADTTFRPVYQFDNTGWAYDNMDLVVAYRITVTGSGISQVADIIDRWHSPTAWPVTSVMNRTLSTSNATAGFRYLRAVYPQSAGLNNNTYKFGQEISNYNSTSRTIQVDVFKTATGITWNETKPAGTIYTSSTYQTNNQLGVHTTRGWIFRAPASFNATSADGASRVTSYESATIGSSAIRSGAAALVSGHLAFLADDGRVYDISNTAKNMVCDENAKIGYISSNINANTAIDYRCLRPLCNLNSTAVGYISHGTLALGDRVYLRCTMDSSGNIHSDNYLATSMAPSYTWVPFGIATASDTIYMDTRKPTFYTLNSAGDITHVNGKLVSPDISITNTDPGEGVSLDEGHFVAVTGSPDYSDFLDVFYPVGSYYETSDTSFDPNVSWGGTWVEDTDGRVLVAVDSGTFSTVGDTGGAETAAHSHWQSGGSDSDHMYDLSSSGASSEGLNSRVVTKNRVSASTGSASSGAMRQTSTYETASSTLQPYTVVKRWHRTA